MTKSPHTFPVEFSDFDRMRNYLSELVNYMDSPEIWFTLDDGVRKKRKVHEVQQLKSMFILEIEGISHWIKCNETIEHLISKRA